MHIRERVKIIEEKRQSKNYRKQTTGWDTRLKRGIPDELIPVELNHGGPPTSGSPQRFIHSW